MDDEWISDNDNGGGNNGKMTVTWSWECCDGYDRIYSSSKIGNKSLTFRQLQLQLSKVNDSASFK
jgi:hypothetical protein